MKTDLYTKLMLTIIAVGIVVLVIQNFTRSDEEKGWRESRYSIRQERDLFK